MILKVHLKIWESNLLGAMYSVFQLTFIKHLAEQLPTLSNQRASRHLNKFSSLSAVRVIYQHNFDAIILTFTAN